MKRFHLLTLFAALTLLLCCILPTPAEAATSGYYTYTVSYGKATITGCDTAISGTITIPSTLGGYPVTSIGRNAFYNCRSLTGIIVPDSVISIGDSAFYACTSLTSITIPDSVISIGDSALKFCEKLTSVTLPESITHISYQMFMGCSDLTSITIPGGVTSIDAYAFENCVSLTSTVIPNSVTQISKGVFRGCSSLNYNTYDNAKYLGNSKNPYLALIGTVSADITSCVIHENTKVIAGQAFYNRSSLSSVTIGKSVISIGNETFDGCSSLMGIWVNADNTRYSSDTSGVLFNKDETELIRAPYTISGTYIISDSVTSIGYNAFRACSSLTNVTIGSSVTSIGDYAFYSCSSLSSVTISGSITSVGFWAFNNCSELNHVAYAGTQAQWAKVQIGSSNTYLTNASQFHFETAFEHVDTCAQTGIYCPACQVLISGTTWTLSNPNPKVPHQIVAATCTAAKSCTVCGATEGEAAGHSGQWIELVTATCTTDGINARICSVCGETETQNIAAPGHSYSAVVTAPTCTEQGYTTNTCSVCGDVTVTDYVDANGHDYTTVVTAPTCTEKGYTTNTCTVCGNVTVIEAEPTGHSWSAWITAVKPTCTTEGAQMRFCNCGTRETETLQKLPHSCENYICTVCGELDYANTVLTGDVQVNWNLTQDLYVDLAGFNLSGTIVTNGFKVYGMDSTTDGYTCESIGYFTCVDENSDFIVPERIYTEGEKRYMAIRTEDRYSFHWFFVGVTHMSLEPEVVGLGYKAAIFGDEMVMAQLAETNAFSFRVQLEGYNPVYRHFDSNELASGDPITLRIRNYDVENYSEHNLYAQVSLTLNDGTVIETEQVALTFRWLTEQVNANYTDYTADQLASFRAMLQQFTIVKKWDIPNII